MELDVVACSSALSACEKGLQWSRALQLFQRMRSGGQRPDVVACGAAVGACEAGQQWALALGLFVGMLAAGIRLSQVARNTALDALADEHGWGQSLQLLGQAQILAVDLDAAACNAAVGACGRGQRWAWAARLLSRMRHCSLRPDAITYDAVALSAQDCGQQAPLPSLLAGSSRALAADAAALPDPSRDGLTERLVVRAHELLDFHGRLPAISSASAGRRVGAPVCRALAGLRGVRSGAGEVGQETSQRSYMLGQLPSMGASMTTSSLRELGLAWGVSALSGAAWLPSARLASRRASGTVPVKDAGAWEPAAQTLTATISCTLGPPPGATAAAAASLPPAAASDRAFGWGLGGDAAGAGNSGLLPVFAAHDRSPHAERGALLALLGRAGEAAVVLRRSSVAPWALR